MPLINHPLESSFSRLEKFRLYETATFYYLVGFDNQESMFRLLKINRLIRRPKSLAEIVREDDLVYSSSDIAEILKMIDDGNKTSGGLVKICSGFGIVGFVKFLDCFYLTLITQRKEVGCIAGNFIYSIKATEMFPVRPRDEPETNAFRSIWKKLNKKLSQTSNEIAESRYMGLFQFIDMTKDFFFSYTYDLTHSLQHNYVHAATAKSLNRQNPANAQEQIPVIPEDIFQWNHFQVNELQEMLGPVGAGHWVMPLVHGSFQQKRFSLFGKCLDIIMIARRSRYYAGTRYLKRGINVHGKAANDCEVEQIIQHEDSYRSNFCAYLQVRASIPTYWYQETSVTMPKPPILISRVDPDYRATEEHVADLFRRYSAPIIALDLVKQHEKRARESMVGREFRQAVEVVNESIPVEHKVRYIALDYSRITSIAKGKNKGGKGVGPTAAGNVVGQEWKNLVESSMTADTPPVDNRGARDSPVQLSLTAGSNAGSGKGIAGSADAGDDDARTAAGGAAGGAGGAAARWHSTEVKIDVLRELEDIASMTINETGFFCNTSDFLNRVKQLPREKAERVKLLGHMEQRGVLRTNCIDCLDRTNGAQFAVAMKFLTVSLQALGVLSAQQSLEPTSQLLVSLMEMYGEMGDKIALQYGGSEAHRKVPGGQVASSAKQSELLTSIKRYYSNAFTDMVKQDAMNVFLGCFQPTDTGIPLWDLESDYDLHNQSLAPPPPLLKKVIFDTIYTDSYALAVPAVRQLIESSVKKTLTDVGHEHFPLVPLDSKKRLRKVLQSEDPTIRTDKIEDVAVYLKKLGVPDIDRDRLMRSYFIKHAAQLQKELEEAAQSVDGQDAGASGKAQLPARIYLKMAIRNIGRLEKRKFLRSVASKKISSVAATWWKSALLQFEECMYGSTSPHSVPSYVPKPKHKPPSYFHRVYPQHELSEFDVMLSLDFFAPVEAALDAAESNTPGAAQPDARSSQRAKTAAHASATAATALAKRFDREYLSGSSRPPNSYAAAHMYDEYPAPAAVTGGVDVDFSAAGMIAGGLPPRLGASTNKTGSNTDGGFSDIQDTATANAGFQITRYMRKLVGGFLRKEDSAAAPTTSGKASSKARDGKREWNWHHHLINFHEHRVPRKTSQLYTRYVTIAQNNLLLMEKMGNQRLAEEEYFLLLRDYHIDVDNVSAMEHLSIEAYVSSEINQGTFQGMQQRESAVAAYAFLSTALVQIEKELQASPSAREVPATEPFAPVPVSVKASQSTSSHKRGGSTGAGASAASKQQETAQDSKTLVRTTLQRNPALETHIERCLQRVEHVRGLDREFRKTVGDYITQQAAYAKETSYNHLATRLGANSSESSIIEYSMQFDHLSLAQDLDNIDFLARCSPAYESFQELNNLAQVLAPVRAEVKERKKTVLEQTASQQAPAAPAMSVTQQLGLGGNIPALAEDLQKDYSLDMYSRPFPYVDNIALTGVEIKLQGQQFYQLDSDLYVRSTNPFMQLNEVAVNSLSRSLLSAY